MSTFCTEHASKFILYRSHHFLEHAHHEEFRAQSWLDHLCPQVNKLLLERGTFVKQLLDILLYVLGRQWDSSAPGNLILCSRLDVVEIYDRVSMRSMQIMNSRSKKKMMSLNGVDADEVYD